MVSEQAETALVGVTFDCSDTRRLADFYRQLLGSTETGEDNEDWVQPQPQVRVYADPDGHPFCLFEPHGE